MLAMLILRANCNLMSFSYIMRTPLKPFQKKKKISKHKKEKKKKKKMTENSKDLPQDCWGLIFKSLPDERHFESISLVSHRFLSITNNLRSSLNITHQTLPLLSKLFLRFKNLKRLDLSYFHGDPDAVLNLISLSELDLKSLNISNLKRFPRVGLRELGSKMKNLEELNCSKIRGLQDADLFAVSDCCLSLEALDISFPIYGIDDSTIVTDSGVVTLSRKLPG
ncbi:hypothetical protein ACOSQ3_015921 [Xanthoceras sorbifolium]